MANTERNTIKRQDLKKVMEQKIEARNQLKETRTSSLRENKGQEQ